MRPLSEATDFDLTRECNDCDHFDACGKCPVLQEREFRLSERETAVECREIDCDIRETNFGQDRDVYHNGSIIKGGGVSRPEWMDDDRWGEYRMSAEYAYEVSHNDGQFDEPDYDERDCYDEDYSGIDCSDEPDYDERDDYREDDC